MGKDGRFQGHLHEAFNVLCALNEREAAERVQALVERELAERVQALRKRVQALRERVAAESWLQAQWYDY